MSAIARTDTSVLGRWWWTVDRWLILALGALIFCGVILAMAASPAVASRIGVEPYHFVKRQLLLLPVAILLMGKSAGDIAFYAYIVPFLVSTAGGAIIAGALLAALSRAGALRAMQASLS